MKESFLALSMMITLSAAANAETPKPGTIENQTFRFSEDCQVHVLVQTPPADIQVRADVLFLIGFADRADNHGPLFEQMVTAGYRVISFDYPSQGETNCGSLNDQNFTTLSEMATQIVNSVTEDLVRPLYLTGWSTGGLLAMRMAQLNSFPNRKIAGLLLLAPGLAVRAIPGYWGRVTMDSLLSNPNPPHKGPIQPTSPLSFIKFSLALIWNGFAARYQALPDVPILIFLGGSRADVYADTSMIKRWISVEQWSHSNLFAFQCNRGKHELDNEIEPMGSEIRANFVNFLLSSKGDSLKAGTACKPLH